MKFTKNIKTSLMAALLVLSAPLHAEVGGFQSNEKADITFQGVLLNGNFVPGGPINEVDASTAKGYQNGKCLFDLEYNLKNKGDVKTQPVFKVILKNGPTTIKTHNLLSLDANSGKILGFSGVELSPGLNKLGLYADSDNVVNESNESNNYRKTLIKIKGSCSGSVGILDNPNKLQQPNGEQRSLPAGPKPNCKLGLLAVLENSQWQCKEPSIKSNTAPKRALPGGQKPKCKLGLLPVMEDGQWQCKQPSIKAR